MGALVQALLALDDAPQIVALGGAGAPLPEGVARVPEPWHPPTNAGWVLAGLPRAAAAAGVDVLHAPAYTAPPRSRTPVVLTIHDVSYERMPAWYPYRRDSLRRLFYRLSARAADEIITDSAFSAREIAAAYAIPPERISIVPLGVSPAFSPDSPLADTAGVPDVPFVLHVGDLHERRNLGVVVDALLGARRRGAVPANLALVLAGVDRGAGRALVDRARRGGAADAVRLLGPVGDRTLHGLYRCAAALVYPSRYEGFGLPVLEAMASGLPVIASRAASIPEVAGEAGLLIDPEDADAWADAIARVVANRDVRERMRTAGLARAAAFTWTRTARETLAVYRRAVERAGR